jgi:hypothetical protein
MTGRRKTPSATPMEGFIQARKIDPIIRKKKAFKPTFERILKTPFTISPEISS